MHILWLYTYIYICMIYDTKIETLVKNTTTLPSHKPCCCRHFLSIPHFVLSIIGAVFNNKKRHRSETKPRLGYCVCKQLHTLMVMCSKHIQNLHVWVILIKQMKQIMLDCHKRFAQLPHLGPPSSEWGARMFGLRNTMWGTKTCRWSRPSKRFLHLLWTVNCPQRIKNL